jgi:hypothetical protein
MTDPISNFVRNTISTVQRFTSQASQPAPAVPAPVSPAGAAQQVQQAYEQDRFQEQSRMAGGVVAGLLGMAPPVTGGAPPISTVEGLDTLQDDTNNPALEPLQRFLQTAVDPQTGQPYLGGIDNYGYFGSMTRGALANFQRDQGLEPTGRPNAETLAALQDPRPPVDPRMNRALAVAPEDFGAPRGAAYQTSEGLRQDYDGGYMIRDRERNVTFMSYDGQMLGQLPAPEAPATGRSEDFVSYRQGGDTEWGDLQLGTDAEVSIRESGCAVVCAAMCISTVLGREVNPKELDGLLDAHEGYSGSLLKWNVAASETGTTYDSVLYDRDELNQRMADFPGNPIALQVMVSEPVKNDQGEPLFNPDGTPQTREWPHWVVVTHAETGENGETLYHAVDPSTGTGTEGAEITLTMDANDQLTATAPWGKGAVTYSTTTETGMRQYFPPDSGA